ncbi:MAG: DUF4169 family protein [Rubellimicrobium sp.]|nr:DUF4169 family protein [Rubellimicrobium sp.]
MSDPNAPVNLNCARKDRARAEAKVQADANAARHGRTKAERVLEAARQEKARRHLDQHRFEE